MNNLHIHEILRMMIDTQKVYTGKADFVNHISQLYGEDAMFFSCSQEQMNVEQAFDFLIKRNKINISDSKNVVITQGMTMCDENNHHNHHHDHY